MVALANANNAAALNAYYVESIKHEVEQAYFRHHEQTLKAEEATLALEIYLRTYSQKDINSMRQTKFDCFLANTIQFFYLRNEEHIPVRLNLTSPMPFSISHKALVIEEFDELATHYFNLIKRLTDQRQSEELTAVLSRIDAMANRLTLSSLLRKLKEEGGYIEKAVRSMRIPLSYPQEH